MVFSMGLLFVVYGRSDPLVLHHQLFDDRPLPDGDGRDDHDANTAGRPPTLQRSRKSRRTSRGNRMETCAWGRFSTSFARSPFIRFDRNWCPSFRDDRHHHDLRRPRLPFPSQPRRFDDCARHPLCRYGCFRWLLLCPSLQVVQGTTLETKYCFDCNLVPWNCFQHLFVFELRSSIRKVDRCRSFRNSCCSHLVVVWNLSPPRLLRKLFRIPKTARGNLGQNKSNPPSNP